LLDLFPSARVVHLRELYRALTADLLTVGGVCGLGLACRSA
jgi:hypothetical protein